MLSSYCAICLCENKTLQAIIDADEDNITWEQKLKFFIPEEFSDTFKLCKECCEEVDRVNKFKKLCMEALKRFKSCVYSCVNCNKAFKQKTTLLRHIARFHGRNLLEVSQSNIETCDFKENRFNTNKELKLSKVEADFTCNICSSSLKSKYRLKRHLNSVHATVKRFSCNECNQKFVNQIYLKAHVKYHSKERSYVCTKCGKRFFSSSDLNHHEKIHANIRAYRCDICAKSFNTASDRTKHQICVHSDPATWRFSCTVCRRLFPLSGNRDAHERTHTPSKPHRCHLCARAFSTGYSLKRHITAHSEEKRHERSKYLGIPVFQDHFNGNHVNASIYRYTSRNVSSGFTCAYMVAIEVIMKHTYANLYKPNEIINCKIMNMSHSYNLALLELRL